MPTKEAALQVEHACVVGIKADDHAAPHVNAGLLDAVHLVEQAAVAVGPFWIFLVSRNAASFGDFNPDEHLDNVRIEHELHQLGVLGEVDRGLGGEFHRVPRAICQAIISRRIGFTAFLLPMKLSSTMKRFFLPAARQLPNSAMICAPVLQSVDAARTPR